MKSLKEIIKKAAFMVVIMTVLCGFAYPMFITGISHLFFHDKANGSIIEADGKTYGSSFLAQQFTKDKYLWGRVMNINTQIFQDAEGNVLFYASPSNLDTNGKEFADLMKKRVADIQKRNPDTNEKVPNDLVTSSGSGLDPQISYAAAIYQTDRIAVARNLTSDQVRKIIDENTSSRFLGLIGEKVVNVLSVNLALDGIIQ